MTIGQRIAEERKKLGISQEALGEKMGISRQAISKWESDGAIPEIDKLIALSKLFSVSVGWLLGVEETPSPVSPSEQDALSDKQLHMIEEIVKKYHPPKRNPRRTLMVRILMGGLTAFVLYASVMSLIRPSGNAGWDQLYYQLTGIQSALNGLEERVTSMENNGIPQSTPALLASYSFEVRQQTDRPGLLVFFTAVPNRWQEGDTGYLDIRGRDGTGLNAPCDWSGSFLSAACDLGLEDGNALCFTLVHADGTQDQQVLYSETVQNPKSSLRIRITPTAEVMGIYQKGTLRLDDFWFSISMPYEGLDEENTAWEQLNLVLLLERDGNAEEIGRFDYLDTKGDRDTESYANTGILYPHIRFEGLELVPGDYLDLYIEATMSNGINARQFVNTLLVGKNGTLEQVMGQ